MKVGDKLRLIGEAERRNEARVERHRMAGKLREAEARKRKGVDEGRAMAGKLALQNSAEPPTE